MDNERWGHNDVKVSQALGTLECPHCGEVFDQTNVDDCDRLGIEGPCYFGIDLHAKYGPRKDLLGQEIWSKRYGNCSHCWQGITLVNGKVVDVMFIPADMIKGKIKP